MTRFIMSLEEAVDLVLFAFENGCSGDILVQKAPACTIEVLAKAVVELFGNAKEEKNECLKGRVIVSDIYCENHSEKKLDHVKIDRFTGGALDGALFSERVIHSGKLNMEITLLPPRDNNKSVDEDIEKAFNLAIKDICGGRLPLGGGTMRGLGTMLASSEEN